MSRCLVAGAGGFIGGHLVKRLVAEGNIVTAVDIKPLGRWYQTTPEAMNYMADLSLLDACHVACDGQQEVYNLAADMGGMGFIENNKAACMLSVLPSTHMLVAAEKAGVDRFFYSSSACVYAADKQTDSDVVALREVDAYPAEAEDGYGWEKLFTERMCRHFTEDFGLTTRVARYHNVYGPYGTWRGGREKAPAAIIRKVLEAKWTGSKTIEIWGDGQQTRSFMYVADCVEGTRRIMDSDIDYPINLGSSELVSINQLMNLVAAIVGVETTRTHDLSAPQGVRGRNSDNTLILKELDWEPSTSLMEGLHETAKWIWDEMQAANRLR